MTGVAPFPRDRRVPWPLGVIGAAAIAVGLFSYRYLLPGAPLGAPPVLANAFARYGVLTVHAGLAATALIIGPFQFFPRLRERRPRLHRWCGRVYAVCCLGGGAAGGLLALGATTGPWSTAGFGGLAVCWIVSTALAWRAALDRRFADHRRWMIRSYALTLAAVTLRLYLPLTAIHPFLGPLEGDNLYRLISFLCWIPNLIAAEIYLRRS